jgi:hypothetical protein
LYGAHPKYLHPKPLNEMFHSNSLHGCVLENTSPLPLRHREVTTDVIWGKNLKRLKKEGKSDRKGLKEEMEVKRAK